MFRRSRFSHFYTTLLVFALLSNSVLPVAHAQTNTPLYLPIITNGNATPQTDLVFRTRLTVQTPAQWRDLQRMEVVILDQGDDWATVLVDDLQLTDLARWRFSPTGTDTLEALVAANTIIDNTTATSFHPILGEIAATKTRLQVDAAATADARATLRAALQSLSSEQQTFLLAATSVDTDSDGLNDTLEGYWCTDPARADSDFDGANDGTEVQRLKDWMANKLSKAPSSGKPFQGWPPQKTNCFDDDLDSVPDIVEVLELGLNLNRESTDRDKFDDGQELFGLTYCTGQGGYCSYGPLPRNEDWGIIFAEMPSWVKASGNHPMVTAYPMPEIDVVASSLKVEAVTEVTTDHVISEGTERSYSTAKTDGKSKAVADTITWNKWQEVSETSSQQIMQKTTHSNNDIEYPPYDPKRADEIETEVHHLTASAAKWHAWDWVPIVGVGTQMAGQTREASAYVKGVYLDKWKEDAANKCDPNAPYWAPKCLTEPVSPPQGQEAANDQKTAVNSQDLLTTKSGLEFSVNQTNELHFRPTFDISFPIISPPPTKTETEGESWGGSQTVSTEEYEEHTITNGEAFSKAESWGTATAINSDHAADLWFSYKVLNTGSEFAHEICNLTFNIYIGSDPNPAYTYFVSADRGGICFISFDPGEEHIFSARTNTHAIPLTLDQMKQIDLGGPIRIVVEDFTYGIDERFYEDAVNANMRIAIEDGTDDTDETIDSYLIPTWGQESVLQVLARYFPHETDSTGTITAIWTPEYRSDNPSWCQSPRRPTDQPTKAVWCKHSLSTADWWNVYTNGLGDGSEGFQDTQAVPGSVALFRFNKDTDLDGFGDRSETQLGTDPKDAASFPRPEVLAGVHNIRSGNRVTSTLSLLNSGIYDAYGVEAVMVAPDDSVSITNHTVGGSGRVRALKQVIVGSSLKLQTPLPDAWTQANHATLGVGGYYTGPQDRTYTFTVTGCPVGGCTVGSGSWKLDWSDGRGANGQLDFGANYKSPTFLPVGTLGLTLAIYSGNVANGESFTVNARTPRDTFQYTINREPYTEPLVIVSYNDPQGNHRFVLPSAAMSLTQPTANLRQFASMMLDDVGVEIVTSRPFTVGVNSATMLVNNPSDKTLQNAHLFLEVINISGTVVAETPVTVTLPPGPTATPISFDTATFTPAYLPADDYIVMAFLTDYQGNILDTAGRPLSSFQVDPLPTLATDSATLSWDIGTVTQGTLLKHKLALANTGFGRLYTYIPPSSGLALNTVGSRTIGAADQPDYELSLRTANLPVGPYDQTITLATSDPFTPTRSLRVYGTITAPSSDTSGGVLQRPLDFAVNVPGSHSQGEWIDFTHDLGPEPVQNLHPVKVYSQDYDTLLGFGKYAIGAGQGTPVYDMFGDGRDGAMPSSGSLDNDNGPGFGIVNSGSAGAMNITVTDAYGVARINPGDVVLIHQTQGTNAGCWELNTAVSDFAGNPTVNTYQLTKPLKCNYSTSGSNKAQIMRVPQYSTCNVTGTVTPISGWNGSWGGILAVMCRETMNISGSISAVNHGFRGGTNHTGNSHLGGEGGEGLYGRSGHGGGGDGAWEGTVPGGGGRSMSSGYLQTPAGASGIGTGGAGGGYTLGNERDEGGAGGGGGGHVYGGGGGGGGGDSNYSGGAGGLANGETGGGGGGGASGAGGSSGAPGQSGGAGGALGYTGAGGPGVFSCACTVGGGGGGGGSSYGVAFLSTISFGSGGGGGGGQEKINQVGGIGGNAGGIIVVLARDMNVSGTISANGSVGQNTAYGGAGGGGAGGSVLLKAVDATLGNNLVTADGGPGGVGGVGGDGGNGSKGRIRVEYCRLTNTTIPGASLNDMNCYITEQIATTPATGRLNLPETFSDGRTYKVQFGRKLDFAAAGNQATTLRVPAGLYNSVQLDALVSGLPANATLSLDVGNDGSTEWSGTVVNNSTNVSADLAAAFTAYWRSQNSPSGGTLDVPIKVTTSQPGQILLTNLQVSATGSRLRYVRVPVANYTRFLLDFTAGNGGTVALDLGDDGIIDWSTSLAAPRQLTENLNDELNAYLAGKSGDVDVPVRFYLAPLHPITLNDYQATVASTLDLLADSITVSGGAVTAASADALLIDAGSTATVGATLRNSSSSASGPVTAAFFATATGWGDWYIGSAFVANIPANGSAQISIPWNTTGFSGTVPVKVVINPYQRVAETNYNNNRKETSVRVDPPPVLPAAPTGLVATMAAISRINLTWTDTSTNESGFKIERSPDGVNGWAQIATVGANVTTYASSGLACGKAYFYRVRATNGAGDSAFSPVATALTRLCTPALQPITGITQTQLTLLWSDNNSNESGFKLERSLTGATPWSQIATVGANVTTYTNSGLPCGTPYYYRVRAYTGSNNSAYSTMQPATTTICTPAAPTLLAATAISATQINLSWTDASSNESGFKVERSPDGVNGWSLLTMAGANVTSHHDSGLACATTYHYRVRATNAGGDSPNSNVANATTPACLPDLIFADGFESSNLLAWSARAIGGGDLRSSATAALVGSQGMEAIINDNIAMYVTDQRPEAESRYRARFYFDPNSIAMTSGDAHFVFYGYQGTATVVLRVEFRRLNSSYQLRVGALNDPPSTGAATWRTTSFFTISDAPHFLELDWQAATAPGANNGNLTVWIDGVQKPLLTGLDNDTRRIDLARLGPIGGLDTGTRGSYHFDAFESRRRSYIGPAGGSATAAEVLTMVETGLDMAATMLNTVTLQTEVATTMTATVAGLGVQIAFPARATAEPIMAHLLVTDTQSQPDGYSLLGEMMTVQANTPITAPVTVTIAYGAAATGAMTTTRTLHLWNATIAQWEAIPAQVNPETQSLTVTIKAPAIFALWQAETETLPAESVDENTTTQETAAPSEFSIYLPLVQE